MSQGNVLIIGANRLFREGLKVLLRKFGFTVTTEGANLAEARSSADGMMPDLVLASLASGDDLAAWVAELRRIRTELPEARVVALTEQLPPEQFVRVLRAGAVAILTKDISGGVLQTSLGLVMQGQQLIPASVAEILLVEKVPAPAPPVLPATACMPERQTNGSDILLTSALASKPATPEAVSPPPDGERPIGIILSEREEQILYCLVRGFPNKVIARELDIAETTVKVHMKSLLRKLRAENRTQAAIWAMNHSQTIGVRTPKYSECTL
jgi:two-component system nitrate/nitrite response regulator NarL